MALEERYDVQKKTVLGTGSTSVVYEAACKRTGRRVAVKSLRKQELQVEELRRARVEVAIHQDLDHPSIVRLEDTYESGEFIHMVMETLPGGSLWDRLEKGAFSEREAAMVMSRLLGALDHLHRQGIMHRDVKPENVVYDRRGEPRLIDFGFAARFAPGELLPERLGTLQYIAPEVLQGRAYDAGVDIWSAGSVAHDLLTCDSLFAGPEEEDIFQQNRAGQVVFGDRFRRLSRDARDFVVRLLASDPADRPSARQALRHPWLQQAAKGKGLQQPNEEAAELNSPSAKLAEPGLPHTFMPAAEVPFECIRSPVYVEESPGKC